MLHIQYLKSFSSNLPSRDAIKGDSCLESW